MYGAVSAPTCTHDERRPSRCWNSTGRDATTPLPGDSPARSVGDTPRARTTAPGVDEIDVGSVARIDEQPERDGAAAPPGATRGMQEVRPCSARRLVPETPRTGQLLSVPGPQAVGGGPEGDHNPLGYTCVQPVENSWGYGGGPEGKSTVESRESRVESREPRAESREPRGESREPRAESPRLERREARGERREARGESPRLERRGARVESPRLERRGARGEGREEEARRRATVEGGGQGRRTAASATVAGEGARARASFEAAEVGEARTRGEGREARRASRGQAPAKGRAPAKGTQKERGRPSAVDSRLSTLDSRLSTLSGSHGSAVPIIFRCGDHRPAST